MPKPLVAVNLYKLAGRIALHPRCIGKNSIEDVMNVLGALGDEMRSSNVQHAALTFSGIVDRAGLNHKNANVKVEGRA